jgi:hypothetical protein
MTKVRKGAAAGKRGGRVDPRPDPAPRLAADEIDDLERLIEADLDDEARRARLREVLRERGQELPDLAPVIRIAEGVERDQQYARARLKPAVRRAIAKLDALNAELRVLREVELGRPANAPSLAEAYRAQAEGRNPNPRESTWSILLAALDAPLTGLGAELLKWIAPLGRRGRRKDAVRTAVEETLEARPGVDVDTTTLVLQSERLEGAAKGEGGARKRVLRRRRHRHSTQGGSTDGIKERK